MKNFVPESIGSQIGNVWAVEQEILDIIVRICEKHGLRYSLAYGTLLGAVRHGGFIPWDDDIDIIMSREDYDRFIELWPREAPDGYILMNGSNTEYYPNNFTKVVKDHTTFLQRDEHRTKPFHKGIFVDIFPADRVAPHQLSRMVQYAACAVNLLYTREYSSGTGGLIGFIEKVMLGLPRSWHGPLRGFAERVQCRWNGCANTSFFVACTIRGCKHYFPSDIFEEMSTVEFNGKRYCAFGKYDQVLRTIYGDYMQLPPEEERVWHHHPVLIDFEHNYEELNI